MEIWQSRDGSEVAVIAASWEFNKGKISFESLSDEFEKNPIKAWRNYGSVVTTSVESALKDPDLVLRKVNLQRSDPWDSVREVFVPWFRGERGLKYFIHFDLSKNRDATGVAMSHRKGLITVVDFMARVVPKKGADINFAQLRELFIYELTRRGFHIELVTYDGFGSLETRQILEEKGYKTDYLSADRDTDAYDTLIEQMQSGVLDYYTQPIFTREMQELKLINGSKYDHPRKSPTTGKIGCLAGSTLIKLLDGRHVPIRDLATAWDGKPIHLYTIRDGTVSVGVAMAPRLTQTGAETVVVTLDNGHRLITTPDHRFMLRDGSYRAAEALLPGESLWPLYTKISTRKDRDKLVGYEMYREGGSWHFTHRMVGRWKYGAGYTANQHGLGLIHHGRGKLNNAPDALSLENSVSHGLAHREDILKRRADPVFEAKRRDAAVAYAQSPEGREFSRANMKALNQRPEFAAAQRARAAILGKRTGPVNLTKYNKSAAHRKVAAEIGRRTGAANLARYNGSEAHRRRSAETGRRTIYYAIDAQRRRDVNLGSVRQAILATAGSIQAVRQHLRASEGPLFRVVRESGYPSWAALKAETLAIQNHRVVSVETGPLTDVYDLTVEGTENFALSAGVFVHNSKDVSDAVACSVTAATLYALENPTPLPGIIKVFRSTRPADPYRERSIF